MKTLTIISLMLLKTVLFLACILALFIWSWELLLAVLAPKHIQGNIEHLCSVIIFGIWFLYCILSSFGILDWKKLLFSGAIMQILLIIAVYLDFARADFRGVYAFKVALIYALLWWLHFAIQFIYESYFKNTDALI